MSSTYAIVESGVVTNIVLWDGKADWQPPKGAIANAVPDGSPVGPGWAYDGTNYTAPAHVTGSP